MEYKGYTILEIPDGIVVEGAKDFSPVHVFECGQCFRWLKQGNGSFTGVVKGRVANVSFDDEKLIILNSNQEDFKNIWFDYLDLGRDYTEIKQKLKKDKVMERAIEFGHGIRLLRQELWEALASFIISANNRIPRIMKTVAAIAETYGNEIKYEGLKYYSFPEVHTLAGSKLEQLEVCGGGFRCKYILNTAKMVVDGSGDFEKLDTMDTVSARDELMKFPGVGPKVADCVLLYSGTKYDVFPTDVWVKRVMEELYFKREASFKEIQEFSRDYFGELAGFAQQYLFYYARENRIGAK